MGLLARRSALLLESHGQSNARQLDHWINRFMESGAGSDSERYPELLKAVIRGGFHVLYDKDEYEVARLYSAPEFKQELEREFEGAYRLKVHLAPPLLSRIDPATGRSKKREFGAWVFKLLKLLSRLRVIRGRWFDPFRGSAERKLAREMREQFARTVDVLCEGHIDEEHLDIAIELAQWPLLVKGYGPVRIAAAERAVKRQGVLTTELLSPREDRQAA